MYEFVKEQPSEGQFTDIILLEDGTAVDPALKFQNDLDTGLFRPADNTFSIATGGVERVRINNDDTTFYERVKEQSFYNNSYYATIREGLPLVKDRQMIINMITNLVNPYTVNASTFKGWNSVCYSEELDTFVAVGAFTTNQTAYSLDGGINWIGSALPSAGTMFRVKYEGGLFIALHTTGAQTYWSLNGQSGWTLATGTAGNNRDVIYLPSYNLWLICNASATPFILQSTDGKAYTSTGINQPSSNGILSLAFSPELNILVGVGTLSTGANNLHYSNDGGINWNSLTVGNQTLRSVVWSKETNQFIVVGSFERCFYSSDGINWSNTGVVFSPSGSRDLSNIIWIDDLHLFVITSQTNTGDPELFYSFDGRIYTGINLSGDRPIEAGAICYSHKHGSVHMVLSGGGSVNRDRFLMTKLSNRIPTMYNVFNHPYSNSITDLGNWYIKEGASYVQFTASTTTYTPGAKQYKYHCLELNNVAHSTNGTFNLPSMSDGDCIFVQCYCGSITSSGRQIILSNQSGNTIWDARTMTQVNPGGTTILLQAIGSNSNTSFMFIKAQGGSINLIELGDKQNQAMNGQLLSSSGSLALPGISWSADNDTGFFWANSGEMRVSCNNTLNQIISSSLNSMSVPLSLPTGTVGAPSLRFSDTNTGIWSTGDDGISFTSGGINRMYIYQDSIGFEGTNMQFRAGVAGTAVRPFLAWPDGGNNHDTGFYRSNIDEISVSTAGTQRLSVSNSNLISKLPILASNGNTSAPSISFENATGNGLYLSGSSPFNLGISVQGSQKINIENGTGAFNKTTFNTNLDIPSGNNTNPSIVFSGSQNHGIYADTTNDIMSFKVGNVAVMNFNPTSSSIVSQLKTRSIVNDTYLLSTGSNQTLVRLDTLVYGNFIYELTGAIDVNLPSNMTSADVGLCIKIGKNSGAHALTIKVPSGDYINGVLNGTAVLSNSDYKYYQLILVKVSGGVDYWLTQH